LQRHILGCAELNVWWDEGTELIIEDPDISRDRDVLLELVLEVRGTYLRLRDELEGRGSKLEW
jgi:hypothetical protein